MMRAWFGILILLAGCSDSRPSPGPSPVPTPSRVTVSGSITNTVSGAAVGSFSQEVAQLPALLPVSAAGFVTRQAWITSAAPTVDLIPEAGFDLTFYRQFVRGALDGRMDPIRRWTQPPSIYLQLAGLSDATVSALEHAARTAVFEFSGRRFGVVSVETGREMRPPQTGWITVELVNLPDETWCGNALIGSLAGYIRLNMGRRGCDPRPLAHTLAHEVGHAMGFWHVPDTDALMHSPSAIGISMPSPRERHHAAIAYARQPGSRDVDIDPQGSTAFAQGRIILD